MAASDEILVLPFFGQGHLLPCIELCKRLSSRNHRATLIISSDLSSSIPSSLHQLHPLVQIVQVQAAGPPPPPPPEPKEPLEMGPNPFHKQHTQMGQGIESILSARTQGSARPVCAIVDVMMSWSKDVFAKFEIPVVSFFTSGACSAAMEYALWTAQADSLKPGEVRVLPGLPEDMAVSDSDLKRRPRGPPPPPGDTGFPPGQGRIKPFGPGFKGPPGPGQQPPWLSEVEGTAAVMMNTCHDLEGRFLDYLADKIGKPVWGVGPLLPEEYWKSIGSVLHDAEIRTKKQTSHSEEEVTQWLDSKPRGSVLYVSFGSEVGPTKEEYSELATALEESRVSFIWAIQLNSGRHGPGSGSEEGYYPHGLEGKVGDRGLIIHGWAPQLLILSHPSTGGFLSHCGWNSTIEAIGRGVPLLTWPIRGDQFYNAKLVVKHLRIGRIVSEKELSECVKKDDIVKGIEELMWDEGVKRASTLLKAKFEGGFPTSSETDLDAFRDFLGQGRFFST